MDKKFTHDFIEIPKLKRENVDGSRKYLTPEGNHYPSVTTILSHKSKR